VFHFGVVGVSKGRDGGSNILKNLPVGPILLRV